MQSTDAKATCLSVLVMGGTTINMSTPNPKPSLSSALEFIPVENIS